MSRNPEPFPSGRYRIDRETTWHDKGDVLLVPAGEPVTVVDQDPRLDGDHRLHLADEMRTFMISKFQMNIDDILNGTRNNCGRCPIALAIIRRFSALGWKGLIVVADYESIWICSGTRCIRAWTPDRVERFMRRFDRDRNRKPIRFTLTFDAKFR